jgi:hypothetical protein
MKIELLFAVASLVLVSAVVVFALPSPVQAAKNQIWLVVGEGTGYGFKNKGLCLQKEQELKRENIAIESHCHLAFP